MDDYGFHRNGVPLSLFIYSGAVLIVKFNCTITHRSLKEQLLNPFRVRYAPYSLSTPAEYDTNKVLIGTTLFAHHIILIHAHYTSFQLIHTHYYIQILAYRIIPVYIHAHYFIPVHAHHIIPHACPHCTFSRAKLIKFDPCICIFLHRKPAPFLNLFYTCNNW